MHTISERIIIKWHLSQSLLRLEVEADRVSRRHQFSRKKYSRRRRSSESFKISEPPPTFILRENQIFIFFLI